MKWFWNWKPWSFSMHINRWRIICKLSRPWFMSEHSWSLGIHSHSMHSYLTYAYIQIPKKYILKRNQDIVKQTSAILNIIFAPRSTLLVLYLVTYKITFQWQCKIHFLSYVWNFLIFHSKQWLFFLSFCW